MKITKNTKNKENRKYWHVKKNIQDLNKTIKYQ